MTQLLEGSIVQPMLADLVKDLHPSLAEDYQDIPRESKKKKEKEKKHPPKEGWEVISMKPSIHDVI